MHNLLIAAEIAPQTSCTDLQCRLGRSRLPEPTHLGEF